MTKARSLAAVLLVTPILAACSDSTGTSAAEVDRLILFSAKSLTSTTNELYGVMPDGSGLVKLPQTGEGQILFPRRSRDRQQIAFGTGPNGSVHVWTMRGDLTDAHPLYVPTECPNGVGNFSWSPSGDRVLVDCDVVQLVIKVSDGSHYSFTQLLGGVARDPDWSPTGDRILYFRAGDTYVANLDGTGATLVATSAEHAVWSPGGMSIAFERAIPNGSRVIFVANADGSGQRQLTFPSSESFNDLSPAWSPDGNRLVFVRYQVAQPDFKFHLYVINADGTVLRQITADDALRDQLHPDW